MKKVSTEIVLSTYNGEKYILEQLESLLKQDLMPNKVSIYDDCSTDKTVNIIYDFIQKNNLHNWKIQLNTENKGWRSNFVHAILNSEEELIFCCDQDDVWKENKIEKMCKEMIQNPEILVLASDYDLIHEDGGERIRVKQNLGKGRLVQIPFDMHFGEIRKPGCTFCFRKEIIPTLNSVWQETWAHDAAIWMIGISNDRLYYLNEKLIFWRRHKDNNSPISGHSFEKRIAELEEACITAELLIEKKDVLNISEEKIRTLNKFIFFDKMRILAIKNKNILTFVRLLAYIKSYPKPLSWLADIWVSFYQKKD